MRLSIIITLLAILTISLIGCGTADDPVAENQGYSSQGAAQAADAMTTEAMPTEGSAESVAGAGDDRPGHRSRRHSPGNAHADRDRGNGEAYTWFSERRRLLRWTRSQTRRGMRSQGYHAPSHS